MYQSFVNNLSSLLHCGNETPMAHYQVRMAHSAHLTQYVKTLLEDDSRLAQVIDARMMVIQDIQLYTGELQAMGADNALRLLDRHEGSIFANCKPRYIDPQWLLNLNELGASRLVNYLANFCELRTIHDSGVFEDIAHLPDVAKKKLFSLGMKSIHQGYTFEFLDFAATMALESGVISSQMKRFMAAGRSKSRDHFARALIRAVAANHEKLSPPHLALAVGRVWNLTEEAGASDEAKKTFKAELTCYFLELGVPISVIAKKSKDRDQIFSQDLGL